MALRFLIALFVATALPVLAGCNVFSTRDPETPITNRSAHEAPTSPEIVISNFTTSIREKNPPNYLSCFVGDTVTGIPAFVFEPSAEAMGIYPSLFNRWSVTEEQRYFTSLLLDVGNQVPSIELLSQSDAPVVEPTRTIYTYDYIFTPVSTVYKGRMRLTVDRLPNGNWAISRWTDEPQSGGQTEQTWSFLKAEYAK